MVLIHSYHLLYLFNAFTFARRGLNVTGTFVFIFLFRIHNCVVYYLSMACHPYFYVLGFFLSSHYLDHDTPVEHSLRRHYFMREARRP